MGFISSIWGCLINAAFPGAPTSALRPIPHRKAKRRGSQQTIVVRRKSWGARGNETMHWGFLGYLLVLALIALPSIPAD